MADVFNWDELDPGDRVVPSIKETAVYANPKGHIVIRQEAYLIGEEDEVIVLPPEYAERVARRVLEVIAELKAGQR